MHKRFILIVSLLTLLLAGCTAEPAAPETVPTEANRTVTVTFPPENPLPTTDAAAGSETPPAPSMESSLSYPQYIRLCDQSIFSGPGYDYGFVDTVREQGTYTIVEEAADYEGNLWGKLESGTGWVDLTEIRSEIHTSALLSANFANEDLLLRGDYHLCPGWQDYSIPIVFHAYGTLRDVTLFDIEFRAEGPSPGTDLFTLPEMTEQLPLVAELAFPGDMSMYGIRFVDEAGSTHVYSIYISGRNGALVLEEE